MGDIHSFFLLALLGTNHYFALFLKKVAKYFASLENCSIFALAFRAMAR